MILLTFVSGDFLSIAIIQITNLRLKSNRNLKNLLYRYDTGDFWLRTVIQNTLPNNYTRTYSKSATGVPVPCKPKFAKPPGARDAFHDIGVMM